MPRDQAVSMPINPDMLSTTSSISHQLLFAIAILVYGSISCLDSIPRPKIRFDSILPSRYNAKLEFVLALCLNRATCSGFHNALKPNFRIFGSKLYDNFQF